MPVPTAPAQTRRRSRRIPVLVAAAALLLSGLAVLPASAPPATAMPIEGFPSYQPQQTCKPKAKRGTVMLSKHLMNRYQGSGSSGISRSCAASGVSEHKEGRAFDWRISARSKRDRGYATHFIKRLTATDKRGNTKALARRMGIMYLIWNDRIWSASRRYSPRPYLHSACSSRKSCSATLRHRDHMHISLTWKGARARTSWYRKRLGTSTPSTPPKPAPEPQPQPEPAPEPEEAEPERAPLVNDDGTVNLSRRPMRRIAVPNDGSVAETGYLLRAGRTYKITAAGLHRYGTPFQVGDATCTYQRKTDTWSPKPGKRKARALNLIVNGQSIFGEQCAANHVYRASFTPKRDVPLRLRVHGKRQRTGRLTVVLSRRSSRVGKLLPTYPALLDAPARGGSAGDGYGLLHETLTVPATARSERTSYAVRKGDRYRVTVSGTATLAPGVESDGRCIRLGSRWYRAASMDLRVPGADHGNLFVDGEPFGRRRGGCAERTHSAVVTAARSGRMRLSLWDPLTTGDNDGALTVQVQRLGAISGPARGPWERPRPRQEVWRQNRDHFKVRPGNRRGVVSTMRVRKGQRVRVVVTGTHRSNGTRADATCVRTAAGWVPEDPGNALAQDPLELYVEGEPQDWRSVGAGSPCSEAHTYVTRVQATKNGPIRLGVLDLDHRDNKGGLDVTLHRITD